MQVIIDPISFDGNVPFKCKFHVCRCTTGRRNKQCCDSSRSCRGEWCCDTCGSRDSRSKCKFCDDDGNRCMKLKDDEDSSRDTSRETSGEDDVEGEVSRGAGLASSLD